MCTHTLKSKLPFENIQYSYNTVLSGRIELRRLVSCSNLADSIPFRFSFKKVKSIFFDFGSVFPVFTVLDFQLMVSFHKTH